MYPNDLAFSVTALAAAIAEGKSAEELALLASILTQLGDTLTTLSLQSEICKQNNTPLRIFCKKQRCETAYLFLCGCKIIRLRHPIRAARRRRLW